MAAQKRAFFAFSCSMDEETLEFSSQTRARLLASNREECGDGEEANPDVEEHWILEEGGRKEHGHEKHVHGVAGDLDGGNHF